MTRWATLLMLAGNLLLAGCASTMAGLDSSPKYGCKAPTGAQCTSVSGVYANSIQGQLMGTSVLMPKLGIEHADPAMSMASPLPTAAAAPSTSALRSAPRVLSLWVAPWEDGDGDLNEAAVVHVLVDPGAWLIERIRPQASRSRDIIAPSKPTPTPAKDGASS